MKLASTWSHTLHLITPGFRPNFIQKNLTNLLEYREYPFIWHLIMDEKVQLNKEDLKGYKELEDRLNFTKIPTQYTYGFEQRKYFLEVIANDFKSTDWGYFLDDDNLVTPDIFTAFAKYKNDETAKFVLMSQLRYKNPNKRLYGRQGHATLGNVDIGNFIFKLEILKNVPINTCNYSEDGNIVQNLCKQYGDYFKYEEGLMTTYNILQI